jgi:hypothetical protein
MTMKNELEPYEPCPCGSEKKYKFCCRRAPDRRKHPAELVEWCNDQIAKWDEIKWEHFEAFALKTFKILQGKGIFSAEADPIPSVTQPEAFYALAEAFITLHLAI